MNNSYRPKKAHRLPLASMSPHYLQAHLAEYKDAYDYAKGRKTSMGVGSFGTELAAIQRKKPNTLIGGALMMTGIFLKRMFSHRKM